MREEQPFCDPRGPSGVSILRRDAPSVRSGPCPQTPAPSFCTCARHVSPPPPGEQNHPTSEAASTGRRVRAEPQAGVGGGAAAARAAKTNGARSSQPRLRASRNGRHLLMISKQGSKL